MLWMFTHVLHLLAIICNNRFTSWFPFHGAVARDLWWTLTTVLWTPAEVFKLQPFGVSAFKSTWISIGHQDRTIFFCWPWLVIGQFLETIRACCVIWPLYIKVTHSKAIWGKKTFERWKTFEPWSTTIAPRCYIKDQDPSKSISNSYHISFNSSTTFQPAQKSQNPTRHRETPTNSQNGFPRLQRPSACRAWPGHNCYCVGTCVLKKKK